MHVVMLSDLENSGGAAIAASRLAEALLQHKVQVTRIIYQPDMLDHSWETQTLLSRREDLTIRATRKLSRPIAKQVTKLITGRQLDQQLVRLQPDIINIHNIHYAYWPYDLVSVCLDHAPTIWTLHDMWSFTGRCAYSYDCQKFITGCDATCPTPTEYPALAPKLIAGSWEHRRRILAKHRDLVAVTPSRWLAQEAQKGLWAGHQVEVIPYSLPLDVYKPVDRTLAHAALEIEPIGPVLLVAAQNLTDRRKGGAILVEALQQVQYRPFTVLALGHGQLPLEQAGIHIHQLGYIDHERSRVLAYNAADILVHPAPVDNLPNVVLEAIACGTPAIGFKIGGMPDMIRPSQSGWLADELTPTALATTIDAALAEVREGIDLSPTCRNIAETEYNATTQAGRYLKLFAALQSNPTPNQLRESTHPTS